MVLGRWVRSITWESESSSPSERKDLRTSQARRTVWDSLRSPRRLEGAGVVIGLVAASYIPVRGIGKWRFGTLSSPPPYASVQPALTAYPKTAQT